MLFTVSIDGVQWTLELSTESARITATDLVQNIVTSFLDIPIPVFNSLISQRQAFFWGSLIPADENFGPAVVGDVRPAVVGDVRPAVVGAVSDAVRSEEEVLSTVGILDSNSVPADLQEIQLEDMDIDEVAFRPGIDTPFSPTSTFDGFGSAENPIVLNDEDDKENVDPESVRQDDPPPLRRSFGRRFGNRVENVPDYVYRSLFN